MVSAIQTHVFSIIILSLLYFSIKQQSRAVQQKNRYFLMMVLLNIMVMLFKILIDIYQGYTLGIEKVIMHMATGAYYMTTVFIVLYWLLYLQYHVKGESASNRKLLIFYTPFILMTFVSILLSSLGIKAMYTVVSGHSLEKHIMYYAVLLTEYVIMLSSILYVVWHKKDLTTSEFLTFIAYQLPPTIGIFLNEVLPNVDLVWPSMTISLLMVYTNIQSKMTNTDPLTGVFNRREYEKQVGYLSLMKHRKKSVSALMIDIDDFKKINDENSHQMGDIALVEVGQILQRSVRKNDFIARIGGDEFCVIIESDQETVLHEVINRINRQLERYNKNLDKLQKIHLSIGYGIYDSAYHHSFKGFFDRLDKQMYEDKLSAKMEKAEEQAGN